MKPTKPISQFLSVMLLLINYYLRERIAFHQQCVRRAFLVMFVPFVNG